MKFCSRKISYDQNIIDACGFRNEELLTLKRHEISCELYRKKRDRFRLTRLEFWLFWGEAEENETLNVLGLHSVMLSCD